MPPPVASLDRPRADHDWWVTAFGAWYLTTYGHRDEEEARRNAPGIVRLLGVPPHARVLDLACGEGRYARALSSLGYRVTGVDLSDDLLERAHELSPDLPGAPTYVRGDMRSLPFQQQFEAVVSLFTSFGYFDDRSEDAKVLAGVRRALVPGGRLLLDFLNASRVRASLVPVSEERRDPYLVTHRRRLDLDAPDGPYVRKATTFTDTRNGRLVMEVEERVRLYEPEELDAMLRVAGLEPCGDAVGDFDGRPFDAASPRWIRVAARRTGGR
jgi:SAM-dependent methyltransferase